MNTLQDLQQWYQSQCNGDWEHTYGVKIGNVDNPGWSVIIDLADTYLYGCEFPEIVRSEPRTDWIHCSVREGKFVGYGGQFMLEEILRIFLKWAEEMQTV